MCHGTGRDPKKRKRQCPKCIGFMSGFGERCTSCGEVMPCSGTDPNILDQTYCNKRKYVRQEA
jgi:hypothetical protein